MELPRPLANLIKLANTVNVYKSDKKLSLKAMIVTPTEQIPFLLTTGYARFGLYAVNASDDCRITGQLQPGVYLNRVLPHKDNLYIEVIERQDLTQIKRRYRAVPLGDSNPEMTGTNTAMANMNAKDDLNMVSVKFQLMETGFAILKNEMVADNHLMANLADVLHYQLNKFGKKLQLNGPDAFKGVDIERPIDNDRVFKQVIIQPPIPLIRLGMWLQQHDEFGIYTKGFGMYYQKGLWRIYPLFKIGRYEKARKVLNIYRLPEDVFPTLYATYFVEGKVLTVLSTGQAKHQDGKDIRKQNEGTGKRVISSDAVMGEVGYYYANGQAVATRQDSLSEYQTSTRKSKEEMSPFHSTPSNNLSKFLSENALNDGTIEALQWNNSNHDELEPAMPVRYFFMSGEQLKYKEGTLLAARTEYARDTENPDMVFREHSALTLFLNTQEFNAQ